MSISIQRQLPTLARIKQMMHWQTTTVAELTGNVMRDASHEHATYCTNFQPLIFHVTDVA